MNKTKQTCFFVIKQETSVWFFGVFWLENRLFLFWEHTKSFFYKNGQGIGNYRHDQEADFCSKTSFFFER